MGKIDLIAQMDRPKMGTEIPLLIFRAFRHFSSDYVEEVMGRASTVVFQNGGRELGKEVGASMLDKDLNTYLKSVIKFVADNKIGILRPISYDEEKMIIALDECITCVGMPNIEKRICHFEVGLVAGVVEAFTGKKVRAHESKCYANGEETCEVTVDLQGKHV